MLSKETHGPISQEADIVLGSAAAVMIRTVEPTFLPPSSCQYDLIAITVLASVFCSSHPSGLLLHILSFFSSPSTELTFLKIMQPSNLDLSFC